MRQRRGSTVTLARDPGCQRKVRCRMKQLSTTLDETTCKMAFCQHPMCWEAIRRLEKGLPRFSLKSFKSSQRSSQVPSGDLPMLNILHFPHWEDLEALCELREIQDPKGSMVFTPTSRHQDNIHYSIPPTDCADDTSDYSWDLTRQHRVTTSPHSHEAHMRSKSTSPTELKKVDIVEVETEDQKPQQQAITETILVWVPNRQSRKELQSDWPREKKGPHLLSVKDIVFQLQQPEDFGGPRGEKRSKATVKSKLLNKVPTGGRPYTLNNLQQMCINQSSPRIAIWNEQTVISTGLRERTAETTKSPVARVSQSLPMSGRESGKSPTDLLPPQHAICAVAGVCSTQRSPSWSWLAPTHTRVTLHSVKEKQQHTTCAVTYKGAYRMDEKAGQPDTIDHEKMKRQPYLWKKYIRKHGPKPSKEAPAIEVTSSKETTSIMWPEDLRFCPPVVVSCDELQRNLEKGLSIGVDGTLTEQITEEKESLALATQSGNSTKPTITVLDSERTMADKAASKQIDDESWETPKDTISSLHEGDQDSAWYFESKLTTPEGFLESTDKKELFLNYFFRSSSAFAEEEISGESERSTPNFSSSIRTTSTFTVSGEISEVMTSATSTTFKPNNEIKPFSLRVQTEEREDIPVAPPPSPLDSVLAKNLPVITAPISPIPDSPHAIMPE